MTKSILSNERKCYRCGSTYLLHRHHVFAGGLRNKSEKYGCWVYLCQECHTGSRGVHTTTQGMKYWRQLKAECQKAFEKRHSHDLFMSEFQRNWRNDENTENIPY